MGYCIYKHTNKINGKVYIGQTCQNVNVRWQNGYGYKHCTYFFKAIEKYGWNNFDHEILINDLSEEEANLEEIKMIEKYNSLNPAFGYNTREGGKNGKLSEETKRKISNSEKGKLVSLETKEKQSKSHLGEKSYNYGKKLSKEVRDKISNSEKGKFVSEETREKLRKANSGKTLSLETRRKLSLALKGRIKTNEEIEKIRNGNIKNMHPVICIETGKVFQSITSAAKSIGAKREGLSSAVNGRSKTYKGLHWEFYKEGDKNGDNRT